MADGCGRVNSSSEKQKGEKDLFKIVGMSLMLSEILLLACFVLSDARNPITTYSKTTVQHTKTSKSVDTPYSMLTTIDQNHQTPRYESKYNRNVDHSHSEQNGQRQDEEEEDEEEEKAKPRQHPYTEYTWEINQINPWLSACDLAGPDPPDLRGECRPSQMFDYVQWCPMSCPKLDENIADFTSSKTSGNKEKKQRKCLSYLDESYKKKICRDDDTREKRYNSTSKLRLRHCCHHSVVSALAPGKDGPLEDVLKGGLKCEAVLDKLMAVDDMTARIICEFEEVIGRFDCRQTYSVVHNCSHCLDSYRKWICSVMVPYFAHDPKDATTLTVNWTRIRPCRSVCYKVEQTCPYLVPTDRAPALSTQYAGEGTFLCQDPDIPEAGEQAVKSLHSNKGECCYRLHDIFDTGIRANCSEPWKNGRVNDPPTAPHCTIAISSSLQVSGIQEPFCGQGRVGVVLKKNVTFSSSPSLLTVQRFVWIWILFSVPANVLWDY
ncbi:uncharacterized protein LOC109857571 [Pseudomyrmex gracilis]|uniref:uncharacterized protein LOC109857571 n=1 Tax=Pseudomyrmex gracilis TaxID=219809 RepID=UPI000994F808|nr:uncharacterized protein LOC109857571 [Pseudomyrmex gracilis]